MKMNNNEPIRILCVFSCLDRGGAETMCMELYRHIDRNRVQFDFVKHLSYKGMYEDEIRELGGRIYTAPKYKGYNILQYRRWWKNHLKAHPEHKIIHGHYFNLSAIYFKICKKFGRITVAHPNAVKSDGFKENFKRFICRENNMEKYSDYCFACSPRAGEWLIKVKPFTVLKNAIDINKFTYSEDIRQEVRAEFGFPLGCLVIGAVGRFSYEKNPHGILDIFKSVLSKTPDAKLLWIGAGKLHSEIEQRIHKEDLDKSVILTGARSDVEKMMQAMDVFIFPSFSEGLGIVAIEAQAAGLPCLCSDAVPQEAAVTDLCKFLPLDDHELWAQEILSANVERRDTSEQIRKAGYDIHVTSEWLQNFYCNIVSKQA